MNAGKSKVMVGSSGGRMIVNSGKWPCGVCEKEEQSLFSAQDDDWVKKCMEFSVECRRPVGRPRRTWLESVEADMAELEIEKKMYMT